MKWILTTFFLVGMTAHAGAQSEGMPAFSTNAQTRSFSNPRYFSSVRRTNDSLIIQMPLTAEPFNAYLNGENLGPITQDLEVTLRANDILRLQWKRATIWAKPHLDAKQTELLVVRVFDGSNVGAPITTNFFILKEREEMISEPAGGAYVLPGAGKTSAHP